MANLRTILVLSRFSRLPTVWSNCLAGWWLGGGGHANNLPLLFAGATLLYLGGAFLNDAFDAEYDREHRRLRPIPAGAITHETVWRWGLGFLVTGTLLLVWAGRATGGLALVLVSLVVLYNTTHRLVAFSPLLKGTCRGLLYLIGAAAAEAGVTGAAVWCGIALALYISGLNYLAQWEEMSRGQSPVFAPEAQEREQEQEGLRTPAKTCGTDPAPQVRPRYWPLLLLCAPVLMAVLMDAGRYREPGLLVSAVLVLWCARALRQTFWKSLPPSLSPSDGERVADRQGEGAGDNLRRTIGDLVAGIVFVDWLAVCPVPSVAGMSNFAPRELSFAFIALFLAALLFQKLVPEK